MAGVRNPSPLWGRGAGVRGRAERGAVEEIVGLRAAASLLRRLHGALPRTPSGKEGA